MSECDDLVERLFAYQIALDGLNEPMRSLADNQRHLFRVRALHRSVGPAAGRFCVECRKPFPCPTRRLLED